MASEAWRGDSARDARDAVARAVGRTLAELGGRMRAAGAPCGIDELVVAHRALAEVEPTRRATRNVLRCVLCKSPEQLEAFDRAFDEVFGAPAAEASGARAPVRQAAGDAHPIGPSVALPEEPDDEPEGGGAHDQAPADHQPGASTDERASPARWSSVEVLRDKDFRAYTVDDHALARAELRRLAAIRPLRRSARTRRRGGPAIRLDVGRTLRGALRAGGDPAELHWRRRATRPRRTVFVCDVSGSMAPYATVLLRYVHASVHAGPGVEVFCFATRLERVTLDLRVRDPEEAIARVEARLPDRGGGTRIGAAIGRLNRRHGGRIGRSAVVVILSDGWDRGDPGELDRELGRLRRTARRVLWMDPHASEPGYEPLTRGMREALPHADRLLPAGTLRGIEELAAALAGEPG